VSVLQGSDLERRGARDQEDFLKLTPGVQLNRGDPNSSGITIRGLSSQASPESGGGQQNASGSYLEDVPLASPIGKGVVADILPFDLDRIEVLRGPQGALFGSGSLGGAVRYLLAKPELKAFGAAVQVGASSVSQGKTAASLYGMVNAPSVTWPRLRVVAYDRTSPGYIDNKGTNTKDANEVRQTGGRVLVTVKPLRELTATFVASTQKTKQDDFSYVFGDPKKLEHDNPSLGRGTSQFDFSSLTVDYDLGGADADLRSPATGRPRPVPTATTRGCSHDGAAAAAGGACQPPAAATPSRRNCASPASPAGNSAGWPASSTRPTRAAVRPSRATRRPRSASWTWWTCRRTSEGTEKAVFFDGEYSLGGGWSAGLGGRFYKTSTAFQQTGTVFGAPSNGPVLAGGDDGNTPKVSVKYRFGDNMWYALASKGYRYGGVNEGPPQTTFKSDSLWNYETGVRLAPAAGVQLDLTAFLLDWTDAQFTYFEQRGQLAFSGIGNVGKARSTGLEAALRWRINTAFDVAASLARIDAKTTQGRADAGRPRPGDDRFRRTPARHRQAADRVAGQLPLRGPFGLCGAVQHHAHACRRTGDRPDRLLQGAGLRHGGPGRELQQGQLDTGGWPEQRGRQAGHHEHPGHAGRQPGLPAVLPAAPPHAGCLGALRLLS
jgi:iron complex outermembrane receptor protein